MAATSAAPGTDEARFCPECKEPSLVRYRQASLLDPEDSEPHAYCLTCPYEY